MKITIERDNLLKTLGHIHSIVERKSTIPVLSNVKFSAADSLKLSATNVDLELIEKTEATIDEKGETTVPAHILYEIVRKLPDGAEIVMETKGDKMNLKAGKSKFTLSCLPVEDFPIMSSGDLSHTFKLSPDDIIRLIDKTKFAISTEETRYYLNGIYLHAVDGKLRAVATDGHRLARLDVPLPDNAKNMPGVIVPRRVVTELRKLVEDVSDDIEIGISDSKARFTFANSILTSKLIDGKFPDYERVIPKGNDKVLEVERRVFAEAVDLVSAVSSEKSKAIKMQIEPGKLILLASTPESGSGVEELEVAHDITEKIEIGFNSRYLLDIAGQVENKMLRFTMADAASPTVIDDAEDNAAIYVLMPMRV